MKIAFAFLFLALISCASAVSLQRGDKGTDVYGLQYLLNSRGISAGVDGDYGPGTESAVRSFQGSVGLTATGRMNIQTFGYLVSLIRRGSSNGNAVKSLQYMLKHKWFKYSSSIDGDFGPGTETATKNFQYSKNLSSDGIVGTQTWSELFDGTSPAGGSTGGGDSRSQLAAQIKNKSNISLANVHVDQSSTARNSAHYYDSTALRNVEHQASGITPYTSCYKNAPCRRADLSITMMNCVLAASNQFSLSISELIGASHSATSKHYNGWAVDVNYVGGVHVARSGTGFSNALAFSQICRQYGATLVLDPSNEPKAHHNHVHCQWNTSN